MPKLSCYAEYARGLVLKRKKLEDCFNEEKVQSFLTTAESAKFARKLTIWSFLDAPRSNLPRLKLQVNHFDSINGESTADGKRLLYIRFLDEKNAEKYHNMSFFQLERLHKNTPEGNLDIDLLPTVIERLDNQIKKLNDAIASAEFQSIVSCIRISHYLFYRHRHYIEKITRPPNQVYLTMLSN